MTKDLSFDAIGQSLRRLSPASDQYAAQFVEALLESSRQLRASDVHLRPTQKGLEIALRIDGVLQPLGLFPPGETTDIVARLKVLAELLTYRTDVPQEGRIRDRKAHVEMRLSTFPTLHGEKGVVRLFAAEERFQYLADLGFPGGVQDRLVELLGETSGAILITGPAGSGKTTTLYAALREVVRRTGGGRSIATLEDPIEVALEGVAQSQVNERTELNLARGLRSLLRQDPEVMAVGEMRDPETAGIALQAALTGQLVLTTFHAGSAAGAINRLSDMGIEPYVLRSGVSAVVCQRLVRKLCPCAEETSDPAIRLGLPIDRAWIARSCSECHGTGYRGRLLLAEMLTLDSDDIATAVLHQSDAAKLEQLAVRHGMQTRWHAACQAANSGVTSPHEIRRVLGFSNAFSEKAN